MGKGNLLTVYFMFSLLRDLKENLSLYFQDFREALLLGYNFRDEYGNFNFLEKKPKSEEEQEGFFNEEINNMERLLEIIKSVKIDEEVFNSLVYQFYKKFSRTSYYLKESLRNLSGLVNTISQLIDSLPPRRSNVSRYTRKFDRVECKMLKKISDQYIENFEEIFKEDSINNSHRGKLNKIKNKMYFYISHGITTSFEREIFFNKDKDEYDGLIDYIKFPFSILRMTKFVNIISHEISHYVLNNVVKDINEGHEVSFFYKIKIFMNAIQESIYYILKDSYINTFYNFGALISEEIVADILALLISGPSYYFTLFSILIQKPIFRNFLNTKDAEPYLRLAFLKWFISKYIIYDGDNYWTKLFFASWRYIESIKSYMLFNASDKKGHKFNEIIGLLDDIIEDILFPEFEKIFGERSNLNDVILWEWDNLNNKSFKSEILNFFEKDGIAEDSLSSKNNQIYFPDKIFKIMGENKYMVLPHISEMLWGLYLNTIYKYYEENSKKNDEINIPRVPYLRIGRLIALEDERKEVLEKLNEDNNFNYEIRLGKPEEWLFIEMNWEKVKVFLEKSRKKEDTEKDVLKFLKKKLQSPFEEENLNNYVIYAFPVLGEYDFLIKFNDVSTRRDLNWPPLWKEECLRKEENDSNFYITGLYRFRRIINERLIIRKKSCGNLVGLDWDFNDRDNKGNCVFLTSLIKIKEDANLYEFIKEIINSLGDSLNQYAFYMSNSWNQLAIIYKINLHKRIKFIDAVREPLFFNSESIVNKIIERESFLVLPYNNESLDNLTLDEVTTLIQTKGIHSIDGMKDAVKKVKTLIGSYDYIIEWKKDVSLKDLIDAINSFVSYQLFKGTQVDLLNIYTALPYETRNLDKRD